MRKNRGMWLLLLVLILGLAFLIRVWNLNKESFWADEGWTMLLVKGPGLSGVVQTMASDQHPPLYFVLMHYWIALTGNSEFTTRFLSLMWSVVGVALIYRLAADSFSPGTGAIAALLLALADNDTFLAQDARHYTQMAALATASTLFYLRYFRKPTRINGIAWLLASIALMYTHYLGGFILIIQLVHMVIFARPLRRLGDLLLRWGAICLAWLPWGFVFVNQSLVRYTRPILFQSTWENTPAALGIVRNDLTGSQYAVTISLLLLGLIYVTYKGGIPKLSWRPAWPTVYMALWLAVPIVVIIAINPYYPILTTRNFLLVTPVIALLIGHGFMNLDRLARTVVLTSFVIVSLLTVDAYFIKPPWRQVALDILQYRTATEPVLMNVWTDDFALRYHIGRDLHADPATLPLLSIPEWEDTYRNNFYPALLQYLNGKNAFWIAYWNKSDELRHWFEQQGFVQTSQQVETHLDVNKIFIYRFDRLKADAPVLATFGDRFGLLGATAEQQKSDSGAPELRVDLLWKPLQKADVDYSFSVFLLDPSGRSVINHDSSPLDGRAPTSTWQLGEVRFDSATLTLPANLPAGTYSLAVKIYYYVDQKPLPVTANGAARSEYFVVQHMALDGTGG
ncbi:MAG: glycosyltransferase family 39 protein [Chloroflexota bacterium]